MINQDLARVLSKSKTGKRINLRLLTDFQRDFFEERFAIMAYEAKQEFRELANEDEIKRQVFRQALAWKGFNFTEGIEHE
jgi:hypothetical protein